MRKLFYLIGFVTIICPVGAAALTGISVGGKIGMADHSGEIFPGSGDLGSGTGYAVILGFGTVPVVDFEIRASYFAKDFSYSYDVAGNPAEASFEYRDVGLTALLTKSVFAPPGSPFAFYIGGGVGYHVINTEAAAALVGGSAAPEDADNPFALMDNTGKMSGEGVVGLKLGAPVFPVAAFAEYEYGVVFTAERLTRSEFAAGIMIRF